MVDMSMSEHHRVNVGWGKGERSGIQPVGVSALTHSAINQDLAPAYLDQV
jgi:hypothetical protein